MYLSSIRRAAVHKLPSLPYALDALQPHISAETLQYHHGKHHAAYVAKLNQIIDGNARLESKSLEELIKTETGVIYNQAAQIWNHTFYWNCMKPNGGGDPTGAIKEKINSDFGSIAKFREEFSACATGHFGSGWAWLIMTDAGKLKIVGGHDAQTPLSEKTGEPLLTCDVWEHAYYIDYKNQRPKYIESWWNTVNWEFANQNILKAAKRHV